MVINVVNPFKPVPKTFCKSKIRRNVQVGEPLPSLDVRFGLGKNLFKSTLVDVKAKSFEGVKPVHSSSLFNESFDIRAGKQNITSKVKSAKGKFTKLFKFTNRSSTTVSAVEPFVAPGFDDCSTDDYSSTTVPSPIVQHPGPNAPVATASDTIPSSRSSLEVTSSPIASGTSVADENIEDLPSDFCDMVEVSSPSSTGQLFVTPVSPSDPVSSASLNVQYTTQVEDGITLTAANTDQTGFSSFASCISWLSSVSEVTVYFSSNSLFAPSTVHDAGLVIETNPSAIGTSFATSVDAEDDHQPLLTAPRGLRRVPSYEDLRNPQTTSNRDFPRSDISSVPSSISDGTIPSIHAIPLHGYAQCDSVKESFLPFEHMIPTSSTRRTNKFKKLRAWLITRCHEATHNTRRPSATRTHSKSQEVSPSRQLLQGVFRPSARIRGHVFNPAYRPLQPSSPPVWSCAKITRSSSKPKRRQRMTKHAMRELRTRLDSMDVDPWY